MCDASAAAGTTSRCGSAASGLTGVSHNSDQGQRLLGLIGPNGASKTTLFNCITGVIPRLPGTIVYDGRDLRGLKPQQRARVKIARAFQTLELFAELSALDSLVLALDASSRRGVIGDLMRLPWTVFDECRAQEEARAILHFVDLGNYADIPAGDLPVGLRQRLEIGRASRAAAAAPRRAGRRARRAGDGRPRAAARIGAGAGSRCSSSTTTWR
jgi:branched-chain amino acid transport system ATP-binding protein